MYILVYIDIYTTGDIEEIERADGQTLVIVDESGGRGGDNSSVVTYPLDEALISFSSAIDSGDLARAMVILDPLQVCMIVV